jgi:hypothetical protein
MTCVPCTPRICVCVIHDYPVVYCNAIVVDVSLSLICTETVVFD